MQKGGHLTASDMGIGAEERVERRIAAIRVAAGGKPCHIGGKPVGAGDIDETGRRALWPPPHVEHIGDPGDVCVTFDSAQIDEPDGVLTGFLFTQVPRVRNEAAIR